MSKIPSPIRENLYYFYFYLFINKYWLNSNNTYIYFFYYFHAKKLNFSLFISLNLMHCKKKNLVFLMKNSIKMWIVMIEKRI